MASQTIFCKFATGFGNFRSSLLMNRPAITNCIQVAALRLESREKLKSLPEKPKKPATPFFLFLQERKEEVKKTHPDLKVTQVAKKLSEEWNKADASVKKKYEAQYKKSMEGYLLKYLEYNSKLTEEQKNTIKEIAQEKSKEKEARKLKQTLKELGKPKRPRGPFIFFILEYYEKEKAAGVKFQDFMRKTKSLWQNLPKEEKQKFEDMYLDDKKRYDLEMDHWEARMVKTGQAHLVRHNTINFHMAPIRPIRRGSGASSSPKKKTSSTKSSTKKETKLDTDNKLSDASTQKAASAKSSDEHKHSELKHSE